MNLVYEKLQKCYESYKAKIDFTPKVDLCWDPDWAIMRMISVW